MEFLKNNKKPYKTNNKNGIYTDFNKQVCKEAFKK